MMNPSPGSWRGGSGSARSLVTTRASLVASTSGGSLAGLRATAVTSWWASRAWARSCRPTPPVGGDDRELHFCPPGDHYRSVLAGQHDHRNLPRGLGLEFAEGRSLRDQLRPQFGAGGTAQLLRQYRERLGTHLDGDPGVGLEVVVPVWVGWRSSIGGHDGEAAFSLREVAHRRDALGPGLGADVVDEYKRGARPWPADASLVRPELLNDLGVIVAGPARPVTHARLPPCVSRFGRRPVPAAGPGCGQRRPARAGRRTRPWARWRLGRHASLAVVLVVAAPPDTGLVAAAWRAVQPRVHPPQHVDPALVGGVGVVDGAV